MIATAKKDASRLGTLIRLNGTRLPIAGLQSDGVISVIGVYVEFETTIGAAIAFGYALEDAMSALSEAWRLFAGRRGTLSSIATHLSSFPIPVWKEAL
jgi:hypothetical protein